MSTGLVVVTVLMLGVPIIAFVTGHVIATDRTAEAAREAAGAERR